MSTRSFQVLDLLLTYDHLFPVFTVMEKDTNLKCSNHLPFATAHLSRFMYFGSCLFIKKYETGQNRNHWPPFVFHPNFPPKWRKKKLWIPWKSEPSSTRFGEDSYILWFAFFNSNCPNVMSHWSQYKVGIEKKISYTCKSCIGLPTGSPTHVNSPIPVNRGRPRTPDFFFGDPAGFFTMH